MCSSLRVTGYNSQAGTSSNVLPDLSPLLLFLRRGDDDNVVVFFLVFLVIFLVLFLVVFVI